MAVASTICLGGQSACADTQESEVPVEQVEKHRPDGYTSDSEGGTDVAHDSGIHDAHQGYRDIRQNTRYRQP